MIVWRLCRRPHADLSGEGGRLFSGRWHGAGRPVVYTADSPALAILEVRVHLDLPYELIPEDYAIMEIDLGVSAPEVLTGPPEHPREFGNTWLAEKRSAVLRVPSVIAPRGHNFLINPLHPQAASVAICSIEDFRFDARLWNPGSRSG